MWRSVCAIKLDTCKKFQLSFVPYVNHARPHRVNRYQSSSAYFVNTFSCQSEITNRTTVPSSSDETSSTLKERTVCKELMSARQPIKSSTNFEREKTGLPEGGGLLSVHSCTQTWE
jgi:hypothetical protein